MKFNILFIFLINSFPACSHTGIHEQTQKRNISSTSTKLKPLKLEMTPGETKYISFNVGRVNTDVSLKCDGKEMTIHKKMGKISSFIAVPYKYDKKEFICGLTTSKRDPLKVIIVKIKKVKYKTSHIKVPKRKVDLKKSDIDWYLEDKKKLKEAYKKLNLNHIYFNKPFSSPLESKITSPYGAKRIFNNKKFSWHNGIDFRAKIGTPIPSSNSGKVVLVRHLYFNGKTVIIDHGLNIVSLYCHLSNFNVKEGDKVKKGEIIGFGGNTGRSSGPHLHWGMRVQGNWVNGFNVIKESNFLFPPNLSQVKTINSKK